MSALDLLLKIKRLTFLIPQDRRLSSTGQEKLNSRVVYWEVACNERHANEVKEKLTAKRDRFKLMSVAIELAEEKKAIYIDSSSSSSSSTNSLKSDDEFRRRRRDEGR